MLKKWRLMDDRIVSALNCSVLTDSFKQHDKPEAACKKFYDEVSKNLNIDLLLSINFNSSAWATCFIVFIIPALKVCLINLMDEYMQHFQLREVHKNRDKMIKTCIKDISSRVTHLQELKENPGIIANGSQEDRKIISGLRKEQKMVGKWDNK